MTKYAGLALTLISMCHGINHIYYALVPLIVLILAKDQSNLTYGILVSSFLLTYSFLQTPFGYLSKKLGRKRLLVAGFFTTSFSFLILGFIDNMFLSGLLLLLAGVGGSTYHPNGVPFLTEFYSEKRGQATGFHQTGGSIGSVIAPFLLTGTTLLNLDWRTTLIILSIPGFIASITVWFFLPEQTNPAADAKVLPSKERARFNIKLYQNVIFLMLAAVTYNLGTRAIDAFAPRYFKSGRGISDFDIFFLVSMLKVAGLFSGPLSGRLSDIFGRKKVLFILIVIESVSTYAITLISIGSLILPCITFGFASFGLLAITDAFMADIAPKEHMATFFGIQFTASFAVGAVIGPVLGIVADLYNYNLGFTAVSIIIPFSIILLTRVQNKDII
ncbi:MAG: transporter, family, fosmidomycin resistance protein [Thermoproteota archaeon]|nr:transporter, family, fosmidomycin resistance protein [Thermoproteota archaeon]